MKSIEISRPTKGSVVARVEYKDSTGAETPVPTYHLHERTLQAAIMAFLPTALVEITDLTTC